MQESYGVYSLLPPLIAIVLAIISRNVIVSLLIGVVSGYFIMEQSIVGALLESSKGIVSLFEKGWVVKTLVFAIFVGSIIELIQRSGGVDGFVHFLQKKKKLVTNKKEAELLAFFIGLAIFIESSITSLIAGAVSRPLTDKNGTSREKLAYICDSTAAPVCTMFPLNAWGALLLGLIGSQVEAGVITGEPIRLLGSALVFNFYALFSILLVLYTILAGIDFPAYTKVETPHLEFSEKEGDIFALIVPIASLLILVFVFLFITGGGDMLKGDGSTSVFAAVLGSIVISSLYYLVKKSMPAEEILPAIWRGAKTMVPIAAILIFAFAIGDVTVKMGTGIYMAHFANAILHPALLPAGIFLLSAIIAFSTGTSWGTFSIMMPIAITIATNTATGTETLLPLVIAAVISGGVFGDHASPISDTTIISAMAAGCDLIAHVKTQLPWALLAAFLSILFFLLFGYLAL
ncbi:Na+/H+ antiporter NhaC family protein [Hydrogenimonas cancrithermarum]|uniref:Tetracycline efflux Na+/H+ antiporter family transporter Tet(35) n=1 Tax=Hydrogenimonas cancrithermarum TaxID=2993563 RepID=A0ABM8FIX3_9BACT|nr:Na+/H+ antiporter NhaC family protein [Hydrogenimonas cancrithermarum]BDY12220.1 tetracycline efflux Na+/H+ antiporter family transporter Tet(35) [Hydrogenimonas cancrithermarum]